MGLRAWGVALALIGASAAPVAAQDAEGAAMTAPEPVPVTTSEAPVEVEAPSTEAAAFGAPPSGTIRLSPRWDTYVFTTHQDLGVGGGGTTIDSWANVVSLDVDFADFVVRGRIPFAYTAVTSSFGGMSQRSDQAELGNLELEGLVNIDLGSSEHRLLIGGGLALPTATDRCARMRAARRGGRSCARSAGPRASATRRPGSTGRSRSGPASSTRSASRGCSCARAARSRSSSPRSHRWAARCSADKSS